MLTKDEIDERRRKILASVVKSYIETGTPIASKMLVSKYRIGYSPATVRNIMSELELLGYLMHPHTSAGRIPTDKGYRYYVDIMMEEQHLTPSEKKKILVLLVNNQWDEIEDLLQYALGIITEYTDQMGILLYNRANSIYVEKIDLIYINKYKILLIIVADSGDVLHLFLEDENLPKFDELENFLKFINRELKGEALDNIKNKIKMNLISSSNSFYHVFSKPLNALIDILSHIEKKNFFYQGTTKIINYPEFKEPSVLHEIINMLESEAEIISILEKDSDIIGVNIHIGEENSFQCARNCSIITGNYKLKGRTLGAIGVLGPTRLPYGRVVSVIRYVSEVLGQALESAVF